jgi:hypothetical protein
MEAMNSMGTNEARLASLRRALWTLVSLTLLALPIDVSLD